MQDQDHRKITELHPLVSASQVSGTMLSSGIADVLFLVQEREKSVIPGQGENSWDSLIRLHQESILPNFGIIQVTDKDDILRNIISFFQSRIGQHFYPTLLS